MDIAAGKKGKQETIRVEVPPPRWRIIATDLAAGAAAGASVELGAPSDAGQMRAGGGMKGRGNTASR